MLYRPKINETSWSKKNLFDFMVTKTRLIKDQIFHVFLQKGPNRLYKDCFHSSTGKCDCAQ